MAQIKLNKASLSLEQKNLRNYKKYLPSLELKRKKLLSEKSNIDDEVNRLKIKKEELTKAIKTNLPMMGDFVSHLKQCIKIESVTIEEENIVGVILPVFKAIQFNNSDYAYLNTPHWYEQAIRMVGALIEVRIQSEVAIKRMHLLNKAIQTVTQRKNLFEKVLIPTSLKNIRLIQIFLTDNERAAVVRSKLAKKKRQLL